ncbi:acetolactate decarboxylase [Lacticaseibacillus pabuli]|uniref:Alpha-acetolactate decarboxylase n=1 Tax=Lacticaseibacillus pabuli TaxID=3025672 RepID=A0ABY7X0R0_9LACO|nr:acetolactate decarboxylase [Lacticaseibacillus sp. KACC 23028]WDF83755.1 acetolactate decarboxylase [Lacticaseibacillus sp. KACC 23028]
MDKSVLYQHGTLAQLVPGLFQGTLRADELLKHGDTGIGTLNGLNGELIIAAGKIYQVAASGVVRLVNADEMMPFANVHWADFTSVGAVDQLDYDTLRAELLHRAGTRNLFFAVRVHGTFQTVTTRAVAEQTEPYPTLTATAAAQQVFTRQNVAGTLSGYYSPNLYAGAVSPGFHLHFLDDAHQFGGHVLDAQTTAATVELQKFTDFQLHLPAADPDFLQVNLDDPNITAAIKQAEN